MNEPLKSNEGIGLKVGETPTASFTAMPNSEWESLTTGGTLDWGENTGGPSVNEFVGNTITVGWPATQSYMYYYWPHETTDWTGKAFNVAKTLMKDKVVDVKSPKQFVELVESIEKGLKVA